MKQIVVLTTGGTIAMRSDAQAGGAVPALAAADFSQALERDSDRVRFVEFSNLPSAHFTVEQIWALSRRVAELAADEQVDGIVVTHGTDTMEESAYLCDVTVDTVKPVVFTGAMRTASDVGYDGLANLAGAIRTAASEMARGLGTLVVFGDQIHAAALVTKTHTTWPETFKSPVSGPLGFIDYGGIVISQKPLAREFIATSRLEPNVHLIKLVVGLPVDVLEFLADSGNARGIVVEGLGGGRVPPWWLPVIESTIKRGIPVVITSRTGSGRAVDRYGYAGAHRDLANIGCWFAEGLSGPKARIRLMASLGSGDPERYWSHE